MIYSRYTFNNLVDVLAITLENLKLLEVQLNDDQYFGCWCPYANVPNYQNYNLPKKNYI